MNLRVYFLLLLTILSISFYSCEKDSNEFNPGKTESTYLGTAQTVIQYYDYDPILDQDVFIEELTYTYQVEIFIKPPLSVDGVEETNPFNMTIYPDRITNNNEEGNIDFTSCTILNFQNIGDVLFQYWTYTLNGDEISGLLTDTHIAESVANNFIWAWDDIAGIHMVMPFYMSTGTIITGNITQNSINLTISGQSTDTYRVFTSQIQASVN